jgi:Bacterial Ig-like domain (group 2)
MTPRIARLLCLVALAACSSVEDGGVPRTIRPTIVLKNETRSSSPPSGPAVSVLDSIELLVTPENGDKIAPLGRHLSRYNTTATLQPEFPPGNVTFSAQVFSNTHVSMFSGSVTQLITSDVLSVVLNVAATRPVLLMVPDTSRTSTIRSTQFSVYNGGIGSLDWSILSTDTAFTRCGAPCTIAPTSGSLAAGATATLNASVPVNFPSRNFSFVIRSADGNVAVNWLYSASAVTGVTIQPSASLHDIGQAFSLTPTVQATGTASSAVSWASSKNAVATVSASGVVTGASRGVATITATSVVDTSKRATADIRVYDSTATAPSWAMVQGAVPDTVHRDDTSAGSRSTLVLTAQAAGALGAGASPFTAVEFWVRAGSVGPWRRIGQASAPATGTDAGGGRVLSWSYTWNPDATDAPFINPSTTGMSVLALGITPAGLTMTTPVDHDVFVRVP